MPGDCGNSSFVTVLTGEKYVAAAACLPAQLRYVGSTCQLLLLYDDADASLPLPLLQQSYGVDRMIPVSTLKARVAATTGRRLYTSSDYTNLFLKLWLWALPIKRAVFLDLDVVIVQNIDDLLRVDAALAAVFCTVAGGIYYNTGIMAFEPSLYHLRELLWHVRFVGSPWHGFHPHGDEVYADICAPIHDPFAHKILFANATNPFSTCRQAFGPGKQPIHIQKACESKHTDQSIINHVLAGRKDNLWGRPVVRLSTRYNDNPWTGLLNDTRIFHFAGEPKPWAENALRRVRVHGLADSRYEAVELWRDRCRATYSKLSAASNRWS